MAPEPSKWQYRVTWVTDHSGERDPNEIMGEWSARGWDLVSGSSSSWIVGDQNPYSGGLTNTELRTKFTFFWRRAR